MSKNKPRAHVPFNTGTRMHKPAKGAGSYQRKQGQVMSKREQEEADYLHGVSFDQDGCDNHIPSHE
jgi:hypothetical protein